MKTNNLPEFIDLLISVLCTCSALLPCSELRAHQQGWTNDVKTMAFVQQFFICSSRET